jgi:hypothetical protein
MDARRDDPEPLFLRVQPPCRATSSIVATVVMTDVRWRMMRCVALVVVVALAIMAAPVDAVRLRGGVHHRTRGIDDNRVNSPVSDATPDSDLHFLRLGHARQVFHGFETFPKAPPKVPDYVIDPTAPPTPPPVVPDTPAQRAKKKMAQAKAMRPKPRPAFPAARSPAKAKKAKPAKAKPARSRKKKLAADAPREKPPPEPRRKRKQVSNTEVLKAMIAKKVSCGQTTR